ncbi:hypothetical protein Ahy_B01g052053 [Arachis hypogaea]|uniref:CCHC-type domain-containing protein n=1 Tax=Arachis hypogaea TaxID=3818 RepID=A0A445ANF5_ARAHY|nr:hypothetical protein Ahy_B01g052053 [Arachis hypogaea]
MNHETLSLETEKRSSEEEDLVARSTKKVKIISTRQGDVVMEEESNQGEQSNVMIDGQQVNLDVEMVPETAMTQPAKVSYRDRLLGDGLDKLNPENIVEMVAEDYLSDHEIGDLGTESRAPFNPKPSIEVTLEEYDEWCRPWKQTLIVKPLGKRINLQTMERWINRRWGRKEAIRVMDLEEGFFLVRFSSQEDYGYALFEGPWMIADHYLLVQRWRPLFIPQETEVRKLATWVRIPNLLAELYNKHFLWKVGMSLGVMLRVDELTSIHSRGKFARICVEIDLRRKLVPSFTALGKDFKLEYEGLHQICFSCGRYGHKMDGCVELAKETKQDAENHGEDSSRRHHGGGDNAGNLRQGKQSQQEQNGKENMIAKNQGSDMKNQDVENIQQNQIPQINQNLNIEGLENKESPFGPWMVVKKPQRWNRQNSGKAFEKKERNDYVGRFDALKEQEIEEENGEHLERNIHSNKEKKNDAYVKGVQFYASMENQ